MSTIEYEVITEILGYDQVKSGEHTLWKRYDRYTYSPPPLLGPSQSTLELAAAAQDDKSAQYKGGVSPYCSFCTAADAAHTEALHNYLVELWHRGRALADGQEISLRSGGRVTVTGVSFSDGWYPSIWVLSDTRKIKVSLFDVVDVA